MGIFNNLFDHDQKSSFVNGLRRKRFAYLEKYIDQIIQQKESNKILDVGGDKRFWKNIGWDKSNCTITLLNIQKIHLDEEDKIYFEYTNGNALSLPFDKGDFDLVFSNSVIEHVGSKQNQVIFANEVKRISSNYIIQTPSFWFPLEPHSLIPFFQFIPHKIRALLIMVFNINYFPKAKTYSQAVTVSKSTIMLTKKQFRSLFPEGEIYTEKLFGIPKSYTVIHIQKN